MGKTDQEILQQFVDKLVPEIKGVTKRFAPTIESEVTPTSATIYGSKYIQTLIDGRPPTSSGAQKGSPTLQEIILEWIGTKGIQPSPNASGKIPTIEQLSWAISTSIHKNGDLLYQSGGGNNIFEGIITNERIENLLNLFTKKALNDVESIIDIKL
jgi:hypothetical protein